MRITHAAAVAGVWVATFCVRRVPAAGTRYLVALGRTGLVWAAKDFIAKIGGLPAVAVLIALRRRFAPIAINAVLAERASDISVTKFCSFLAAVAANNRPAGAAFANLICTTIHSRFALF